MIFHVSQPYSRTGLTKVLILVSWLEYQNADEEGRQRKYVRILRHGIVFQSMDEVNRYDGLLLVNEYGNLHFLLHNFEGQIIPFKLEKLKKLLEEKRYN